MPRKCRTTSVAILALACSPLAARGGEQPTAVVAQLPTRSAVRPAAPGVGAEDVSPRPGDNASGDQTLQDVPIPTSPVPRVGLFQELGRSLLERGIDIHGVAFDHFLANPSAGVAIGHTTNLAVLRPAADFDLGKLAGLAGANIHVGLTFFGFRSDIPQIISQAGGVLTGFQTTPATQTNLVSLLTYEQRLLGDRLSFEFGRTNIYNYFFLPNSLDAFTNYSSAIQVNGDFASIPYPVWGGRATYKLTPTTYVQAGAFEDNYRSSVNYGDRLGANLNSGAQVLTEYGQRSEFTNDAYPSNMEAGFEWNTRTGRSNLKGSGAPAIPLFQRANYPGGGVAYFQGLKTVWRGRQPDAGPPANIAIYGSMDVAVDKPQPIDMDAMVGANFTGFIPGRAFDALGVQAKYQRLSQVEANSETLKTSILAGRGGAAQQRDGFAFEVVGNIQATPAIAFRPIVEYFVNPDNYYPALSRKGGPRSGFEAGFFAVVSLGRLLGTSAKPF